MEEQTQPSQHEQNELMRNQIYKKNKNKSQTIKFLLKIPSNLIRLLKTCLVKLFLFIARILKLIFPLIKPSLQTFQFNILDKISKINKNEQNFIFITGLTNIGNSCYMNSMIQILSLIFRRFRHFYVFRHNSPDSISLAFDQISKQLTKSRFEAINPVKIKNLMSQTVKTFDDVKQHDAYEWMISFLNELHSQNMYKYQQCSDNQQLRKRQKFISKNISIIDDIIYGKYKTTYTCQNCKKQKIIYEPFLAATVSISNQENIIKPTLQQSLQQFCQPEACVICCEFCQKQQNYSKQMTFYQINQIFVVKVERSNNQIYNQPLAVPEIITKETLHSVGFECQHAYQLFGMVNHSGTKQGGHYTSIGRNQSGIWISYNDQNCKKIDRDRALQKAETACILFYQRKSA